MLKSIMKNMFEKALHYKHFYLFKKRKTEPIQTISTDNCNFAAIKENHL